MAENSSRPDPDDEDPKDPFSELFGKLFGAGGPGIPGMPGMPGTPGGSGAPGDDQDGFDPSQLQAMFGQLQSFFGAMASSAGAGAASPVSWELAKDAAKEAMGDSAAVDHTALRDVVEASRLADLWLDAATEFTSDSTPVRAMTRSEWVESTLPQWQVLAEPVATSAAASVEETIKQQLDQETGAQVPPEVLGMVSQLGGVMRSMGSALFGAQLGRAVGTLSGEVLGGTDAGLPLAGKGFALVPQNIDIFGDGLELPKQEVLLYLALRESAHQRLYRAAPWLNEHIVSLVRDFAARISIDTSEIRDRLEGIDPTNPEQLQEIMRSGGLEPKNTPAQQATLEKLETILALVEGWVDAVVTAAADHLPSAPALRETLRRRRALGGPAEQTFQGLIGLQLRPRKAREASALWEAIASQKGTQWRDDLWLEQALVPTAEDLEDPEGFFARRALIGASDEDFDAALSAWLDGPKQPEEPTDHEDGDNEGDEGDTPGDQPRG
ncbi:zinc-dependent metalloprotease [Galactobacter sp.]|uniref:zinc-dependent metalloprotease n=1 Tax=Galactobacter sp. TaxID=2676125 RepID=UPI0025C2C491|nr:zinc-dependent metalloprotease [Galactobacter sp.]